MRYFCHSESRRGVISTLPAFNGIEFLEVEDGPGVPDALREHILHVHFVNPLSVPLTTQNVVIEGGERIQHIVIKRVNPGTQANVLDIEVDRPGDFSIYTLLLVQATDTTKPPEGYDLLLSSVDFSFKIECANDFDCQPVQICPPEPVQEPVIDYLAKDYATFRRLMLDRMAFLMPQWKERNPADAGIALVELLAYVGDYLSYQQDAISTEAYIGTARRRISIRRHARLVDYPMHEGCNARTWVHFEVSDDTEIKTRTQLLTRITDNEDLVAISPGSLEYQQALLLGPEVFETMERKQLFVANNIIQFYTWGDLNCCLPKGATQATLLGKLDTTLQSGDVLIVKEQRGPRTGSADDADPAHRHAVRLTVIESMIDPLGAFFIKPAPEGPAYVTNITWDDADALPFAFCISMPVPATETTTDLQHPQEYFTDVSVALGNIMLADNGRTVVEDLPAVPQTQLVRIQSLVGGQGQEDTPAYIPAHYQPRLQQGPLTHEGRVAIVTKVQGTLLSAGRQKQQYKSFDLTTSATDAMNWELAQAIPSIALKDSDGETWNPQRDLLNSDASALDFVAEIEEGGLATLRFGDGTYGMSPKPDSANQAAKPSWKALYRVGNGIRGNIGAETLAHIVTDNPAILSVSNPLSAQGGVDPEHLEDVRLHAPVAFRTQERAVTLDDYAQVAKRHPGILQAVATLRWTGSWRTVFLTVDRMGGLTVDDAFKQEMHEHLERYRMAGQDIEIDGPLYVSLEITMKVCLQQGFFWSDVKAALLAVFSNRILPEGRRGVFHPDNFTFGQTIYLSPLYAAAQAIPGISFVEFVTFQRRDMPGNNALAAEMLTLHRLEIARLNNDPNFPERGTFRVDLLS